MAVSIWLFSFTGSGLAESTVEQAVKFMGEARDRRCWHDTAGISCNREGADHAVG